MNGLMITVYFICFALIAGGAFAMMWANIMSLNELPPQKHPEAPEPGDEVMYVDLSREKLEKLYEDEE